jgi:glycerol-3-phosphate acyltransferase PlsY
MHMSPSLFVIPLSYLLGCFTTGYYLVRFFTGEDIRAIASGNAGSRNVGRLLGAKGFVLAFLGDAGKGALVVWLALSLGGGQQLATGALLAVTAGHIWPLQLGFRGGKGFATLAGGLLLLDPLLLSAGLALCPLLYPLLRGTTRCGLISLAATPLLSAARSLAGSNVVLTEEYALFCLLVATVLFAHRTNIRREFSPAAQSGG